MRDARDWAGLLPDLLKGSGWYVTDYGSKKGNEGKARKKEPAKENSTDKKKSKEAPKKDDS